MSFLLKSDLMRLLNAMHSTIPTVLEIENPLLRDIVKTVCFSMIGRNLIKIIEIFVRFVFKKSLEMLRILMRLR